MKPLECRCARRPGGACPPNVRTFSHSSHPGIVPLLRSRSTLRLLVGLVWTLGSSSGPARAQEAISGLLRPSVAAVRLSEAPVIDGRLDDPVWERASRLTRFVQQTPVEGQPATEPTEVWVAYDASHLYFGFHARYSDQGLVRAHRVDRDQTGNDDRLIVFLDPFLDQQRGYSFSVNGYGVQGDSLLAGNTAVGGQSYGGDSTWNVLFDTAGTLTDDGWTAEMAVPFKSLRYPSRGSGEAHHWGFQVIRTIESKDEAVAWAPVSADIPGFLTQLGTLTGMQDLEGHRMFEFMPTLTAIASQTRQPSGDLSKADVQEGGLNLKFGVTSSLTLDFTYNPDFSQIESDRQQIEVNQRFPLSYPELRPFFLEGKDIFTVPAVINFFHTRTIVDPRIGAKLTGTMGRATIGAMLVDDEAPGKVDPSNAAYGQTAKTLAGRLKYALYGDSYVGALVTSREFMDAHSRALLFDGQLSFGPTNQLGYRLLASDQTDQAGHGSKAGSADIYFRHDSRKFTWLAVVNLLPPNLKLDQGFVQRPDQQKWLMWTYYRWWPGHWITTWGPRYDVNRIWGYDGVLTDDAHSARLDATFANNISLNASATREMERFRGIDFHKTRYGLSATVNTNQKVLVRGSLNWGDEVRFTATPYRGHATTYSTTLTLRPITRLQSEFRLDGTRFTDVRTDRLDFDVKIFRALTTYQFTERLLLRNILEGNTLSGTLGVNLLGTYRVNAGTVFFVGYDDRYREGSQLAPDRFDSEAYQRTNRAFFAKLQYLYRN